MESSQIILFHRFEVTRINQLLSNAEVVQPSASAAHELYVTSGFVCLVSHSAARALTVLGI